MNTTAIKSYEKSATTKHRVNSVDVVNTTMKIAAAQAERAHQTKVMAELPPVPATLPLQFEHSTPTLYRVEEIAKKLNTSISYVYMRIAKDKPKPYAKDGKTHLYDEAYLIQLQNTPRRHRSKFVKTILQAAPTMSEKIVKEQNKTLLERIATLESQIEDMKGLLSITEEVKKIKTLLGV